MFLLHLKTQLHLQIHRGCPCSQPWCVPVNILVCLFWHLSLPICCQLKKKMDKLVVSQWYLLPSKYYVCLMLLKTLPSCQNKKVTKSEKLIISKHFCYDYDLILFSLLKVTTFINFPLFEIRNHDLQA